MGTINVMVPVYIGSANLPFILSNTRSARRLFQQSRKDFVREFAKEAKNRKKRTAKKRQGRPRNPRNRESREKLKRKRRKKKRPKKPNVGLRKKPRRRRAAQ